VDNDPALEARMRPVLRSVVGDSNLVVLDATIPGFSEDFGHFQARIPGVMFLLGVSDSTLGIRGMPHAPDYAADDKAIRVGARVMTALVLDSLR
jgi:metal-dependent amidase/aminoacylase/carboxypeptidase family protein